MKLLLLAYISILFFSADAWESCKEVRYENPTAVSGEYYMTGFEYPVYCLFDKPGSNDGWVYFSKQALSDQFKINLVSMYDDKTQARIRILYAREQRETTITQLPQYRQQQMEVLQQGSPDSARLLNNNLGPHLLLKLLPVSVAARANVIQGFVSNGKEIKFINCDANPNSHWGFFSNPSGKPVTAQAPAEISYPLNAAWQRSTTPVTPLLPAKYFMLSEVHMGGCGTLSMSTNWLGASGAALGLRFTGCTKPLTAEGGEAVSSSGYNLRGTISYNCKLGFRYAFGSTSRACQPGNQWSGVPITCLKM